MKKEINIYNLISSLIMLITGIILIANPDMLIGAVSLTIGCLLILAGIIRSVMSLKNKELDTVSLYLGIIIVILGILLITFPDIINVLIKLLFGSWILFAGIQRLIMALAIKSIDSKCSNTFLVTSILMIIVGVLVLINFYNLIGLLLIIYAAIDIIDYVYYSVRNINYGKVFSMPGNRNKKKKTVTKAMKNKKAIDADIEE